MHMLRQAASVAWRSCTSWWQLVHMCCDAGATKCCMCARHGATLCQRHAVPVRHNACTGISPTICVRKRAHAVLCKIRGVALVDKLVAACVHALRHCCCLMLHVCASQRITSAVHALSLNDKTHQDAYTCCVRQHLWRGAPV